MRSRSTSLPPSLVSLILACKSRKRKRQESSDLDQAAGCNGTRGAHREDLEDQEAQDLAGVGDDLSEGPGAALPFPPELRALVQRTLEKLESEGGVPTLPCSRIALGVGDFAEESKSSAALANFLRGPSTQRPGARTATAEAAAGECGAPSSSTGTQSTESRKSFKCERCGVVLASGMAQEHADFHLAQDLQQQVPGEQPILASAMPELPDES